MCFMSFNNIWLSLTEGKSWDEFLHMYMKEWRTRLQQWVIDQNTHPVHVMRYEDLKQDTVIEIEKTLTFLNMSYDSNTLKKQLSEGYSEFWRPHSSDTFEHFSDDQKKFMMSVLLDLNEAAEKTNKSHLLRLSEYLCSFTQ